VSTNCQFAPDGRDMAVRVWRPGSRRGARRAPAEHFTTVYALPSGRTLETISGFVIAMYGRLQHGTAEPGSGLREITTFTGRHAAVHLMASEPRTGRVAVVVTDGLVVLGPDFRVIAQTYDPPGRDDSLRIAQIGFCGPSVLITCDQCTGQFRSWQIDQATTARASAVLPHALPTRFQPLPSAGVIVIESQANADADGTLRPTSTVVRSHTRFFREYLDARTLQPVACPRCWTGPGILTEGSNGVSAFTCRRTADAPPCPDRGPDRTAGWAKWRSVTWRAGRSASLSRARRAWPAARVPGVPVRFGRRHRPGQAAGYSRRRHRAVTF
jgi:hypothetical protein